MKFRSGILILGMVWVMLAVACREKTKPLQGREYSGLLFGLPYHIEVVGDSINYQMQIDSIIENFEKSFSLADPGSVLSRYNAFTRTDTMFVFNDSSRVFGLVYDMMKDYSKEAMGYYDPTTNPLKRAWFFSRMSRGWQRRGLSVS